MYHSGNGTFTSGMSLSLLSGRYNVYFDKEYFYINYHLDNNSSTVRKKLDRSDIEEFRLALFAIIFNPDEEVEFLMYDNCYLIQLDKKNYSWSISTYGIYRFDNSKDCYIHNFLIPKTELNKILALMTDFLAFVA